MVLWFKLILVKKSALVRSGLMSEGKLRDATMLS